LFSKLPQTGEFETAALPHLRELYRTAARLLGDSAKAEDVVQETYLQAWKSFARFEPGTNCRAWLFKILVNTIHHHRRSWFNLRRVRESEEILEQTAACAAPVPERLAQAKSCARWIVCRPITAPPFCWRTSKSSPTRKSPECWTCPSAP
jgi:RNA polymerase sigma factor (sigma-70 family)